jgi:hypothetical protein
MGQGARVPSSHSRAQGQDDELRVCARGDVTDKQLCLLDLDIRVHRTLAKGSLVWQVVPASPLMTRQSHLPQQVIFH